MANGSLLALGLAMVVNSQRTDEMASEELVSSAARGDVVSPDWIHGALLVLVGAVLAFTLESGPGTLDSAKFAFLGHTGGTPHATGYPGYLMALGLFSHVFRVGTLAVRANAFSAICLLFALSLTYRMFLRLGVHRMVAALCLVTFAVVAPVWSQSVVAEVYTFALVFIAGIGLLAVRVLQDEHPQDVVLLCLVYSLSFGAHLVSVMFLPAIGFVLGRWAWRRRESPATLGRVAAAGLAMVLVGVAQYGYLFVVTALDRPYLESPVSSLADLWRVVTGGQFTGQLFGLSLAQVVDERVPMLVESIGGSWMLLVFATAAGLAVARNRFGVFFALSALGNLGFVLGYAIFDIESYLLPMHWFVAVFTGFGIHHLLRLDTDSSTRRVAGLALALFLVPSVLFAMNLGEIRSAQVAARNERVPDAVRQVGTSAVVVAGGGTIADSTRFELWAYELIGNRKGAKHNIWLSYAPGPAAIANYLQFGTAMPAELGSYRNSDGSGASVTHAELPTGMEVFVVDEGLIPGLKANGMNVERVDPDLRLWTVTLLA